MPSTFNVMFLGNLAIIDPFEGNNTAENASALVGLSFGTVSNPLFEGAASWSPVGNPGTSYNQNNNLGNDFFQLDGGGGQIFDAASLYSATLTYVDGSTATISAVISQDTAGNTYLVPEFSANADQAALEAAPIRSISLDSLLGNTASGLTVNRQEWDYMTCFAEGTRVKTASGPRRIQNIRVGDLIPTFDSGIQPVRWIGESTVEATEAFAPVVFKEGAIGNKREIRVSQQHRVLMNNWQAELHTGWSESLVAAKHLVNGDDIVLETGGMVTYFHLLFDHHELIWSEGALTESFHPGEMAMNALDKDTRDEVLGLFPQLGLHETGGYGPTARPEQKRHEAVLSAR
ncbi:Hint domain-containing protein [Falsiphaeobacter marinintestinus]|uniref:Hint domain-containing protein n=1 Tax=Falsiphaeobacter marinintestinus TaxID=1492905 RepID=UPI0011B6C8D3|nr:Hint domain-containing protein [Phaeobacter marinintestinus]